MIEMNRPCLADIVKDDPLNEAEEHLVKMCGQGEGAVFGDEVPREGTPQNTIRAGLIRHIMLGGCDDVPVGPKGARIRGAWITGVLDLQGCETALDLALGGCHICETPTLRDARLGAVMLPGCVVPGLNAHRLKVVRSVLLNKGFNSNGPVDLSSANIGGALACDGGVFDGLGDMTLNCNAMTVGASVLLCDGFKATGQVNLRGAQIAGQFACSGGEFDGVGDMALNCNAMTVGADVFLHDGFKATGQVNLVRAQITGQFACSGGEFDGVGDMALQCNGMTVGADVFLNGGIKATGQVNLRGAQIAGQFACSGGEFDGAGDMALNCNAMTVGADVFLRDGFKATGQVNLVRVQIDGNLMCAKAEFNGDLDCEGMTVGGGFYWQDVAKPPRIIIMTDAHVGTLRDDVGSWSGCLPVLNGFRYERIISEMTVRQRLAWLARKFERWIEAAVHVDGERLPWISGVGKDKFDPQPYSQLGLRLRDQGNASGSARVLVARERRLRRAGYLRAQAGLDGTCAAGWMSTLAALKRPVDWMFGLVFGYGHQPARALVFVGMILTFCFWLYGAAYNAGQMAPNSDVVLTSDEWQAVAERGCATEKKTDCEMPLHLWQASHTATDYETFNRGLYALDLFVPLDALGQETAWAPSKDRGKLGWWAYYLRFAVQMSGWIITAVAAAALTGVIGRKE